MSFKKIKQSALQKIGLFILNPAVNVLCKSLKIEYRNYAAIEQLEKSNQNFIAAFWHGSMLVPWYIFRSRGFSALVSQSKDGELLTKLLTKWNYNVVRGSSNAGGKAALQIMIDKVLMKENFAITPDGPKGPEKKLKPGTIVLAKKTGAKIILVGAGYCNYRELNSWDKFKVPKFFSKVVLTFSEPISVKPNLSYDEVSQVIIDVENKLNNIQTEAVRSC